MRETKILSIINRKGGAGKSTCAAHLSLEAVNKGLKTILIDLDPQKTLEMWWKKREEDNPYLVEVEPQSLQEVIANINNHDFDLCIIDTPGDTSINAANAIKVADLILIPTKPTAPDLSAIGRTISMAQDDKKNFTFVITQAIPRGKAAFQAVSLLSAYGEVAPSILSNRTSYANAMSNGSSASSEDKCASQELNELWKFISAKIFNQNPKENNDKEKIQFNK